LQVGSRAVPAQQNLDFADALSRRLEPARCPLQPCGIRFATSPNRCDAVLDVSKTLASTRRGYFAFRFAVLRFAVLRAVFFAADFVFDFAFFAILPS